MYLQDSQSEQGTPNDDVRSGVPLVPEQEGPETTQTRPPASISSGAAEGTPEREGSGPILGVVVVYSEVHESDTGEVDSRLGLVYPLRKGEILFVGRYAAPSDVLKSDGGSGPPTYHHHFPSGGLYSYVSRRHLTVEMDPLGGTILTDYSRYGIYLEKARKRHRRDDPSGPPESHRVNGEETVILMDDLGETTNRDLADRRSHYRLHILRPARQAGRERITETRA